MMTCMFLVRRNARADVSHTWNAWHKCFLQCSCNLRQYLVVNMLEADFQTEIFKFLSFYCAQGPRDSWFLRALHWSGLRRQLTPLSIFADDGWSEIYTKCYGRSAYLVSSNWQFYSWASAKLREGLQNWRRVIMPRADLCLHHLYAWSMYRCFSNLLLCQLHWQSRILSAEMYPGWNFSAWHQNTSLNRALHCLQKYLPAGNNA